MACKRPPRIAGTPPRSVAYNRMTRCDFCKSAFAANGLDGGKASARSHQAAGGKARDLCSKRWNLILLLEHWTVALRPRSVDIDGPRKVLHRGRIGALRDLPALWRPRSHG